MNGQIKSDITAFIVPIDVLDSDLTSAEKLVCISLYSCVNPRDRSAAPSMGDLAKMTSMSKRNVTRVVKSLEDKGYISVKRETRYIPDNKTFTKLNNTYTLTSPSDTTSLPLVTPRHYPSDTTSPPLVTPRHYPSDTMAPNDLKISKDLKEKEIKDDDDREAVARSVFEGVKDRVTQQDFDRVYKRVQKHSVVNFEAYLLKAVEMEIKAIAVKKEKEANEPARPQQSSKRNSTSKKPPLELASKEGETITKEEYAAARALAAKIDSGQAPAAALDEERPF